MYANEIYDLEVLKMVEDLHTALESSIYKKQCTLRVFTSDPGNIQWSSVSIHYLKVMCKIQRFLNDVLGVTPEVNQIPNCPFFEFAI